VRKGGAGFLRDRALRLGLPFLVGASILAPLAYYPTYLAGTADPHPVGFWRQWRALGVWPSGPVWFLWVLLAFDAVIAAVFTIAPHAGDVLGRLTHRVSSRPLTYFGALLGASAVAYVPLAVALTPWRWVSAGPFWIQISRVLLYAVYFAAGIGLGVYGSDRGLLARDGMLARRWSSWVGAALAAFAPMGIALLAMVAAAPHGGPGPLLVTLASFALVLCCATASLACLAVFVRFARTPDRVLDSLGANSYGIFVLHFACVSWLQLLLLQAPLPSLAKALVVVAAAVALSWSLSATLRRVPAIAAVL
jgi:peptidoglycan/LPS O-acetylase OafA/YrhL